MSGVNATTIICWFLIVVGMAMPFFVYGIEKKRIGGTGIGTMLSAAIVLYSLMNPAAYLIRPEFALNYFGYIGQLSANDLLPGILAVTLFLVSFTLALAFLPSKNQESRIDSRITPIKNNQVKKLILLATIMLLLGIVFFLYRNLTFFGSIFGSFNTYYKDEFARPEAGFFSNFASLLEWSILVFSLVIFWQIDAKKWNKLLAFLPICFGVIFAILEGNRVLIGMAVFVWIGWHFFRAKITPKLIIIILAILTLMTLLANARYIRGEGNFSEKILIIFSQENFRPFWSGDPVGPSVVLTLEALRIQNIRNISSGAEYLSSIESVVPSFIWKDRPMSPSENFAQRYDQDYLGKNASPGTGYAYSAVAEAFVNFWYFGCLALGVVVALMVIIITHWYSTTNEGINRAITAIATYFVVWIILRSNLSTYIAPVTIIGLIICWYTLHTIEPSYFHSPFNKKEEPDDDF